MDCIIYLKLQMTSHTIKFADPHNLFGSKDIYKYIRSLRGDKLTNCISDLQQTTAILLERANPADSDLASRILLAVEACEQQIGTSITANLMMDIAMQHESTAKIDAALEILGRVLCLVRGRAPHLPERRAMNNIGVCYLRACRFDEACDAFEAAVRLARSAGEVPQELAVLANVVALLVEIGLPAQAIALALHISQRPDNTRLLEHIQFQNAVNGLKLCLITKDVSMAKQFYDLARTYFDRSRPLVDDTSLAQYEAMCARYLLWSGRKDEAKVLINLAISKRKEITNLRIMTLLVTTKALCENDDERVDRAEARLQLENLFERAVDYPTDREEILQALIVLSLREPNAAGDKAHACLMYKRRLQEHFIAVKHRSFFTKNAPSLTQLAQSVQSGPLQSPSYDLPHYFQGGMDEKRTRAAQHCIMSVFGSQVPPASDADFGPSALELDKVERSPSFNVAENWAIAAEFMGGGSGQHCFDVGCLAGLIAKALNLSNDDASQLELASRLHDIGRIVVNAAAVASVPHLDDADCLAMRDHTIAGEALLSRQYDDPVLRLAASVARHHHEHWNGCGFPDGLVGVEIPLEARICAVADAYVSLRRGRADTSHWLKGPAVLQIQTMMGMQLDPGLRNAFMLAVEDFDTADEAEHSITAVPETGLLFRKRRLLDMLVRK